jgi:hypothetical protein
MVVVKDQLSLLRFIRNKTPFTFPENSGSWDLQDQALEDDELEFLLKFFEESKVKKIDNLMLSGKSSSYSFCSFVHLIVTQHTL